MFKTRVPRPARCLSFLPTLASPVRSQAQWHLEPIPVHETSQNVIENVFPTRAWGADPNDLYVMGINLFPLCGTVCHFDGTTWETLPGTLSDWNASPGSGPYWGFGNHLFLIGTEKSDIVHYDGTTWTITSGDYHLYGIWGSSPNDVFAVGNNGSILHYNGTTWAAMASGTTGYLSGVWGTGPDNVFAVGGNGSILHYDGTAWSPMASNSTEALLAIWGSGPSDVYAAGVTYSYSSLSVEFSLLRFNGTDWQNVWTGQLGGISEMIGLAGIGPNDVFAGGHSGTILHYNGTAWSPMDTGMTNATFIAFWGSGPDNVYAAGEDVLLHYNGTSWTRVTQVTAPKFLSIWGSGPNDVYLSGIDAQTGRVCFFHFDGDAWSPLAWPGSDKSTILALAGPIWGSGSNDIYISNGCEICHLSLEAGPPTPTPTPVQPTPTPEVPTPTPTPTPTTPVPLEPTPTPETTNPMPDPEATPTPTPAPSATPSPAATVSPSPADQLPVDDANAATGGLCGSSGLLMIASILLVGLWIAGARIKD